MLSVGIAILVPAKADVDGTGWRVDFSVDLKPWVLLILRFNDDLVRIIACLDEVLLSADSLILLQPLLLLPIISELPLQD